MADLKGSGLHFDYSIGTTEFDNGKVKIVSGTGEIKKAVEDAGKSMDKMFSGMSTKALETKIDSITIKIKSVS